MDHLEDIVLDLLSDRGMGTISRADLTVQHTFYEIGIDSLKFAEFTVQLEACIEQEIPEELLEMNTQETILEFLERFN